jgi:chromosomal replication initiation ATPase DnaA
MKSNVFNKYVDKITVLFGVTKEELFSKTKRKEIVDPRQLLYYLCHKRPMSLKYIEIYMIENGYYTKNSNILYGVNAVIKRINEDEDYSKIIKEIEESVSIN